MKRLIFGCGYLGRRVAENWLKTGDSVYAITRSQARAKEFRQMGIEPIIADITDPNSIEFLPQTTTVLFAVGMDRTKYDNIRDVYVKGLQNVVNRLSNSIEQLIYISSTGVYGDFSGDWVNESSVTEPSRDGGQACLEAEKLIEDSVFKSRSTILRLAGIYGPDRVPTRSLIESKNWQMLSPSGYLNLIHVDDAASVVQVIGDHAPNGDTFLVSDGNPVLRQEYYEFVARQFGINRIDWKEQSTDPPQSSLRAKRSRTSKRISNKKLTQTFDVKFDYPNYQVGLRHALNQ